ncbi:hypothetical protein [Teredinibacter turnerae]|uniref:hypothetical protein n=1 Tax=Teredinibacter turnerae TaxID=2426 RepID=UPI000372E2AC|nr:hypothetical protein [Teredinibacter turnerae]
MNQYQEPSDRFLEVVVGLITILITLVFAGLFFMLVINAGPKYVTFIGGAVLLLAMYWFGLISVRLVLNKPNAHGGLFSIGGLKFLSMFVGVSALVVSPLTIYMGHWAALVGCICLSIGCYQGWHLASRRGIA